VTEAPPVCWLYSEMIADLGTWPCYLQVSLTIFRLVTPNSGYDSLLEAGTTSPAFASALVSWARGNGELTFAVALLQTTVRVTRSLCVASTPASYLWSLSLGLRLGPWLRELPQGRARQWREPALSQQQSPRCDVRSVDCMAGITVLADRCTFERESCKHTFGTRVGQDLRIQLPARTRLGMTSNWTGWRLKASAPTWKLLDSSLCIPFSF